MSKDKKSLYDWCIENNNENLLKEWGYEKNENLTPHDVTAGSGKKVWWKCEKGHEWEASIDNRRKGRSCPVCSNRKVLTGYNDLKTLFPKLMDEWSFEKNTISPEKITAGSDKKVWWKCSVCGYEWEASISHRTKGRGCPICARKINTEGRLKTILAKQSSLLETHPDIAKEWHPSKNGDLKPSAVTSGSGKKIWWKCEKGHEWEASINNRANGTGCPYCSGNIKKTHEKFVYEMSKISPSIEILGNYITVQSKIKCRCKTCGHEWEAYPNNLLKGNACAKCAGKYKRTKTEFEEVLFEKNPNIKIIGNYKDTKTKVECQCLVCNHVWMTIPSNLLGGRGCPVCGIKNRTEKLKKTHEEYVRQLSIINPYITVLGYYKNSQIKIKHGCNICNYEWDAVPQSLLQGTGCPICSGKMKKSHEKFVSEIAEISPTIEVLSEYVNAKTKVKCRCKTCGYEWETLPSSLLNGSGCSVCNKRYRRKPEEFIVELNKVNPNIEMIGEYINTQVKVRCRCKVCSYEWDITPSKLLSGQGCPICGRKRIGDALRKPSQQFKEEMLNINSNIELLEDYITQDKKIRCKCKVCGCEWNPLASNLLKGQGCPECGKKRATEARRKTHEQFIEEINGINPKYKIISQYISDKYKVRCKCIECEHEWEASPSNLLKGSGCPACAHIQTSFVEQSILLALRFVLGEENVLSRNRSAIGKELDIYIPELQVAIEPGSWYWHKNGLKKDEEKRKRCEVKGIRLITIYDSFNDKIEDYNFHKDVITIFHNLGEMSFRDELKTLIQTLIRELSIDVILIENDFEKIFSLAKETSSRKTTKEVINELKEIHLNIELLSKYLGEKTKMKCRCLICGNVWSVDYGHLIRRKQGCPLCNTQKKKVINLNTGELFVSASEAARQMGVTVNAVGMVCRGKAKSCKGAKWAYVCDLTPEDKIKYNILE